MSKRRFGFDLDGVLLDQTPFKVDSFFKNHGIQLERWQVSSNVIDDYVPDKAVRQSVGRESGMAVHASCVEPQTYNVLAELCRNSELYLISTRGKSAEGRVAAETSIDQLGIGEYFTETLFVASDDEKKRLIVNLDIDGFADDRVEVVVSLQGTIPVPVLYDPFQLQRRGLLTVPQGVCVVTSLVDLPAVWKCDNA